MQRTENHGPFLECLNSQETVIYFVCCLFFVLHSRSSCKDFSPKLIHAREILRSSGSSRTPNSRSVCILSMETVTRVRALLRNSVWSDCQTKRPQGRRAAAHSPACQGWGAPKAPSSILARELLTDPCSDTDTQEKAALARPVQQCPEDPHLPLLKRHAAAAHPYRFPETWLFPSQVP